MSKKVTAINSTQLFNMLTHSIGVEFASASIDSRLNHEAIRESIDNGVGYLAGEIASYIISGNLKTYEWLSDACVVQMGEGLVKMFITVNGTSRKGGGDCTTIFGYSFGTEFGWEDEVKDDKDFKFEE